MMFQVGDDGVVSSVNEEDLIYIDKNELEQFVESYHKLEKENEQLKSEINMLKTTNGRNEAYIKRLTETCEWHC